MRDERQRLRIELSSEGKNELSRCIDREVKMGSYSANSLSYILLKNNNSTILGNTIR